MDSLQLNLKLANKEQLNRTWAFAKSQSGGRRHSLKYIKNSVITACSKEAKNLGVRSGMRYEEAKMIVPEMKVLVLGRSKR